MTITIPIYTFAVDARNICNRPVSFTASEASDKQRRMHSFDHFLILCARNDWSKSDGGRSRSSRSRSSRSSSSSISSSRTLLNKSLATSKLHMFKSECWWDTSNYITTQNMFESHYLILFEPCNEARQLYRDLLDRDQEAGHFVQRRVFCPMKSLVISIEPAVFKMSLLIWSMLHSSTNVSSPLKFITLDLTVTAYHSHPHIISYHHH